MTDKITLEELKQQIQGKREDKVIVKIGVLNDLIAEIEKQSKIINLMAERLTTDIHSKEWVIDYYEREVEK